MQTDVAETLTSYPKTHFTLSSFVSLQKVMKQLFSFLDMQFVLKLLPNPDRKHSIAAEATTLQKSAALHNRKILIFSRGKVILQFSYKS